MNDMDVHSRSKVSEKARTCTVLLESGMKQPSGFVKGVTAKKYCKCGDQGLFEHSALLFFFILTNKCILFFDDE